MNWWEHVYQCRATEQEIREWLSAHGYDGPSAEFGELDLHAVEAPGWVQVYRFDIRALPVEEAILKRRAPSAVAMATAQPGPPQPGQQGASLSSVSETTSGQSWVQLYGATRDDQRCRTEIAVFSRAEDRDQVLTQWSEGLSRRRQRTACRSHCMMDLVWFAVALMGVMVVLVFLLQ